MGYMDRTTKELYAYLPALTRTENFDAFWEETIREARAVPLNPVKRKVAHPIEHVDIYDIQYDGMDGTPIHGWYIVPAFLQKDSYPCLIHYHGFTHHRGEPSDFMHWAMMGFAVLSIDCRDQGGATGSRASSTSGFAMNVASRGVHNRYEYYYRFVYMDCMKAIDFACAQAEVDSSRIVVEGGSQGGALTIAMAALDDRPVLAMADVPSNSNLERRVEGMHGAFAAVTVYIKQHPEQLDHVLEQLSYFDTMNMADRITCSVFASVALKDEVCPPDMFFATYNRIKSEKQINIYPFNGHEGGGAVQTEAKLAYIRQKYASWFA
ncbi:Cephalosporin-C deacetylase [Paenibacillus curdlanolyticus YK9]|uniref:Cephalosporin-C deacetylase n=1 Tax=Paenibacillus curdlanolyticus YK9 TaxID=717606 RepID=E0IFE5_9BACL|nr:acetylxylan esterase [Paenibacillus curdlanolyticus]EFM08921.1 Cephalosporin-C deacetylase [Paenibacillus curdlanolyticus YK9]